MNAITWLHLSDLHYCKPKTGWDAEDILGKLRSDFIHMEEAYGIQPDLIFFTGDLVLGNMGVDKGLSLKDQFDEGYRFLEMVRTTFSKDIPKENVFLVPGNHEVNRELVIDPLTEWLDKLDDEQKIMAMIQEGGRLWQAYIERLEDYREFLDKYGFVHLLADPTRLIYVARCATSGITLGIAGFNSAWSSCRPSKVEKGRLRLGAKWQLATVKPQVRDVDFSIALIHHPPNWFAEEDDKNFRTKLQESFKFCLHGHEHEEWVLELENGHTTISAGACYQGSHRENGYNFVRLDFDRSVGEVWLREYKRAGGGGWVPNVLPERTDNNGKWTLTNTEWMATVKPSKRPQRESPATPISSIEPKEVLLIEDEPPWQSILNRELREAGYIVDPAFYKDEAMFKIARYIEKYDLIILDPSLDKSLGILAGSIVLDEITRSSSCPPVVIVSGYEDFEELKVKLGRFETTIIGYFEKRNFDPEEFRKLLSKD